MKNLLIVLGLIAAVSSVSANSLTIVKSEKKAVSKVTTANVNTLDIGDEEVPRDKGIKG